MNTSLFILFALLGVATTSAASFPLNLAWEPPSDRGPAAGGQVVTLNGRSVLKIENTNDEPCQVHLLTLPKPGITKSYYVVSGEVKHDSVRGTGYLEMWSCFAPAAKGQPEARYFSRTLGTSGRMGHLAGTSDWRPFELPFNSAGSKEPPLRLELNLHLEGRGTVYLSALKLEEFDKPAWIPGWWTPKSSGILGSVLGTTFGLLGASVGILTSMGRYRRVVMFLVRTAIALGVGMAVFGLVAWIRGQPAYVWTVPLLAGLLVTAIFSTNISSMRRRIEEAELRRMTALDSH